MTYFFHQIFAVLPFIFLMGMVVKIAAQDCDRRNTDRRSRKQRKAAGGKSGRRPGGLAKVKRGKLIPSKAKTKKAPAAKIKPWFVAPKLSDEQERVNVDYQIKRDFVR